MKKLSTEDRVSLRGIINKKLDETRMIGIDAAALIKELRAGCAHESKYLVWVDGGHTHMYGSRDPQIKCIMCGLKENLRDTRPPKLKFDRKSVPEISREEFEMLGVIPPLPTG